MSQNPIIRLNAAVEERTIFDVLGNMLQVGDPAPDFTLDYYDGDKEYGISLSSIASSIALSDKHPAIIILNVINALNTLVCDCGIHRWDRLMTTGNLPPNAVVYTISKDVHFLQDYWRTAKGIGHQLLSAHRGKKFGQDYGVWIRQTELLQRAVFVLGYSQEHYEMVVHAEYVYDQMQEPNYLAAVNAAQKFADSH
ncbi:redoxin domain-containing protein [Candidatus Berkelbacteria bacterium]|nr:redoxin domain-containing protein [Candidatus Berkelbacteria bacterium]